VPRYRYSCNVCEKEVVVFHGINETHTDCSECEEVNTMQKLLSTAFIANTQQVDDEVRKTGALTEEYIERNREVLQQQIKEAKGENYEPS